MEVDVISVANTLLVWAGVIVAFATILTAIITIIIALYFGREAKKTTKEAINKILTKISQDSNIRNKLVDKILEDEALLKAIVELPEFKERLDIAVKDQLDLKDNKLFSTDYNNNLDEEPQDFDIENLQNIDIIIDDEKNLKESK